MPVIKQRLIFQGKLLQNIEKLKTYKISDESVIHLVAKSVEENQGQSQNTEQSQNQNSSSNNQNAQQSENTESRINIEDLLPTLIEFPVLRSSRRQRRRRVPHFDISECFESMHQNINSVHNLLNCKFKYDENQISQTKTIVPYDFSKAKYEVGQWVDVKDTIDQWLEAQVIQVRNNLALVHYNGWGTRWDEWIEFSSPRIAPFKTYTMQSSSSVFLSPYPHVPCDANVEPQPRSIDSFYYLEKSVGFMSEVSRTIDYLSKLRKKNINRIVEERRMVKRDDFEESKDKENNSNFSYQNSSNRFLNVNSSVTTGGSLNQNPIPNHNQSSALTLSTNDYELLFYITQIIPLMDRCGRLISDVSLQLSHLVLNPNLYPQLLLGYNQNIEVSDTLSCTSGYSMYTNEGSTFSGVNYNLHHESNSGIINNLQNRGNILNSNQMVNNYTNVQGMQAQIPQNTSNTVNVSQSQTTHNHSQSSQILNSQTNISSSELPFINRLQANNMLNNNNTHTQISHVNGQINSNSNQNVTNGVQLNQFESFPKINLQVPSMLSPGEVVMYNGYNSYLEPNIDIYVHTLVSSNNSTNNYVNTNTQSINSNNSNTNPLLLNNILPVSNTQNTNNSNITSTSLINTINSAGFNQNQNLNSNNLIIPMANPFLAGLRGFENNGTSQINSTLINSTVNQIPNINTQQYQYQYQNNPSNINNYNNNLLNGNINNTNNSVGTATNHENDLITNLLNGNRIETNQNLANTMNSMNNLNLNSGNAGNTSNSITNNNQSSAPQLSNLLENLMNMIGQRSNRRGSVTSDTSSNSALGLMPSNQLQVNNQTLNSTTININANPFSSSSSAFQRNRGNNGPSITSNTNRVIQNSGSTSIQLNTSNLYYKENATQTDMPINLLSLQKDKE